MHLQETAVRQYRDVDYHRAFECNNSSNAIVISLQNTALLAPSEAVIQNSIVKRLYLLSNIKEQSFKFVTAGCYDRQRWQAKNLESRSMRPCVLSFMPVVDHPDPIKDPVFNQFLLRK